MSLGAFRENMMDVTMPFALMQARVTADDVARIHLKMNDELLGIKSGNYESLLERGSALSRSIHQTNLRMNEKSRKSLEDFLFLTLNNRLAELEGIIAQARAEFDEIEQRLINEYGEDYLQICAEKYLDEETLAAINALPEDEQEAATWKALYDLSHDEGGNMKPQYDGIDIFEAARRKEIERKNTVKHDAISAAVEEGDPEKAREVVRTVDPELITSRNSSYGTNPVAEFNGLASAERVLAEDIDQKLSEKETTNEVDFDLFKSLPD